MPNLFLAEVNQFILPAMIPKFKEAFITIKKDPHASVENFAL